MVAPGAMAGSSYSGDPDLARRLMVENQIKARGVEDPRVLEALGAVPRHRFLDPGQGGQAYQDHPLPLGPGQTISQPYIVAIMAEALHLQGTERVLEVGSGCGYMAAVLARLAGEVFGIELDPDLCDRSRATLEDLGIGNVAFRCGDGALGWPSEAPFQAILLSCATDRIPPALWEQLALDGRLLLPLGAAGGCQDLTLATRTPGGAAFRSLLPVVFVPML